MAYLNNSFGTHFGLEYAPMSFLVRFGKRELFVCRDFRNRYYKVNPVLDCSPGVQAGHVELLILRRWLVIFSKAREIV